MGLDGVKELSTAWWNVIRRQMNATPAKPHPVPCPDCGSQTHLMRGKYGRFYKCWRFDCHGTAGANLDGTPRKPKGPRALTRARIRARNAVHRVVVERDRIAQEKTEWRCIRCHGESWWNEPHTLANCKDDFRAIYFAAKLEPIAIKLRNGRKWMPQWEPVGLHLRKRTIEECERVVAAAEAHLRSVLEEEDRRLRIARGHAWDVVLVGTLGEDEPPTEPKDPPLSLGWG